MDPNIQHAFDAGRTVGTSRAVSAIHRLLDRYTGPEHHDEWMALMEAINVIQEEALTS